MCSLYTMFALYMLIFLYQINDWDWKKVFIRDFL